MIEEILSPGLRLIQRQEEAQEIRKAAATGFSIGDKVKAGPNGYPGILESISPRGFACIRWDDGSCLCGVEANHLQKHEESA